MFIPTRENYTKMTPIEFEQFVMMLLDRSISGFSSAKIQHNEIIKTADGKYQIDGTIRFELMGVQYLTLVECKMYKHPYLEKKFKFLMISYRQLQLKRTY